MNDLDTLRPEVREALACMDSCATVKPSSGDGFLDETWLTIRAELLRLATIEADALIALDCEHDWQVEHKRAEKAEAELAALKTRMKPCARVRDGEVHVYMDTAHEGKEVAVVVVEE